MYNYIFKKMVTWLQIEFFPVIGMGLGVTNLVTNGYIGYKQKVAIMEGQSRVIYTARMNLSLFTHGINI